MCFFSLDDQGGFFALMNEVACGARVLSFAGEPILAHLGRLGHDFPPQPLFRYSFLMIECQIEILAGVKEKRGGRKGNSFKKRNLTESEILRLSLIQPA